MPNILRRRSSPALVVAIIALVAVTAGTATAATKVLIKSSGQVRDGALEAKDFSSKARKTLQGNRGPAGPAGVTGATGPSGAAGPAGARGPSEVRVARGASVNAASCPAGGCDADAVLRTLELPAGSFVITASAEIAPAVFVADASRSIECHLNRTDTGEFQRVLDAYKAPGNTGVVADQTVALTWALTLEAPTTVTLTCGITAIKFKASNTQITATQVGSLTEIVA